MNHNVHCASLGRIGAIAPFLLLEDVAREKYNIWSRSSLPWKQSSCLVFEVRS